MENICPKAPTKKPQKSGLSTFWTLPSAEKFDTISGFIGDDPEKLAYLEQIKQISFAKANLESENYSRITFNINGGVEDDDVFELVKP